MVQPSRSASASKLHLPDSGRNSPSGSSTTTDVSAQAAPPVKRVAISIADIGVEGLNVGPGGPPSPYVSVRVGATHMNTPVRKRCAMANWKESFDFQFGAADVLYITAWDDETLENVGEVWLTAPQLLEGWSQSAGKRATVTASLEGPDGEAGVVTFSIVDVDRLGQLLAGPSLSSITGFLRNLLPDSSKEPPPPVSRPDPPAKRPSDGPISFKVTIVRAQALQTLLPCPNAFVVVRDGVSTQQTVVRPMSNDPVWEHPFHFQLDPDGELQLEVAHDDGCRGVSLATVRMQAKDVPVETGPFGMKYTLRGPNSMGSAVLVLRFESAKPIAKPPTGTNSQPAGALPEGRRVAPVVRVRDPEAEYAPIDINNDCLCKCHGSAASGDPISLVDPSGPCSVQIGVLAALLPPWLTVRRSVFVTLRCNAQYHKTAARVMDSDEAVWDEAFSMTLNPTDTVSVALQETDGAGVGTIGSAHVKRSELTSVIPYHEMWVKLVESRGDPAGELLLAVTTGTAARLSHRLAPLVAQGRTADPSISH